MRDKGPRSHHDAVAELDMADDTDASMEASAEKPAGNLSGPAAGATASTTQGSTARPV